MDTLKEFTITMTPEEAQQIIKDYFKRTSDFNIDKVNFDIQVEHKGYPDEHGYHIVKSVICKGLL